ncbi:MAG: hypothetical protein LUG91_00410 [Ruminococcus sp.]|nr:hypothetical protein [Ruminococcus sp.]
MTNFFESTYEKVQEIKRTFQAAASEAEKELARKAYHDALAKIEHMGSNETRRIWNAYSDARECGNAYLDLHEVIWDKDVEPLISCMRANGIERFTFSSHCTDTTETAWLFQQNGCTLEGLIEINTPFRDCITGDFEKKHGLLFRV